MAPIWDIVSSGLTLAVFLGGVYGVILFLRYINQTTTSTRSSLQSKGVTLQNGRLSVKTDMPAPSREEYIASTQRAFERGGKAMSLHPDAFKVGHGEGEEGKSSAVETGDKKGFQRGKKLA